MPRQTKMPASWGAPPQSSTEIEQRPTNS